jgi:hypothetical protein
MCLIFVKEKDSPKISKKWCEDVWVRNNDGWGIAYPHPTKKTMTIKTGMDFNKFWDVFSSLQNLPLDVVVHMRMATQGEVSLANNHPFLVSKKHNLWMMHNGCCDYPPKADEKDTGFVSMVKPSNNKPLGFFRRSEVGPSDTYLLVERLLNPMLDNMEDASSFIRSDAFNYIMEKVAGRGNRFTFHDNQGHVLLDLDSWDETTTGIPVSNTYAFSLHNDTRKGWLTHSSYGDGWLAG